MNADLKQQIREFIAEVNDPASLTTTREHLAKAVELLWCSGSADFNEGGVAREGWLKVCAPLLKGESHDPL